MNKNFAMTVLQTVSHTWAEACPPPCVNTTNELPPFGHRRGKKLRRGRYDSRSVRSQERLLSERRLILLLVLGLLLRLAEQQLGEVVQVTFPHLEVVPAAGNDAVDVRHLVLVEHLVHAFANPDQPVL